MALASVILLIFLTLHVNACKYTYNGKQNLDWWKNGVLYQIYPRSFKDSDGDGIGDLGGIISKLEYFQDIGVDVIWISPIYPSPQADFGYDISDYNNIDLNYGNLDDFDKLVAKAKTLGIRVMMDFVPNHTSREHQWFKKSTQRIAPYDNYYIWKDPKFINGERRPPNNWLCTFGGSSWEWNHNRQQYYYHKFSVGQVDLNYRSPELQQEMKNVLLFWLKRGVDGFRVDAIDTLFEDIRFLDEPWSGLDVPMNDSDYLYHMYTQNLDETYEVVESWAKLLTDYELKYKTDAKFMIIEIYTEIRGIMRYYEVGGNPFNLKFIIDLKNSSTAADFKRQIDEWMNFLPNGKIPNWVVSNHDNPRAASRFGYKSNRADQLIMLATILPGVVVVYYGDEIGMSDRKMSWEESVDSLGCNAGKDKYELKSRDPARTPFQWDNTTSAGFSSNPKTWLPVNENYLSLNLAFQKLQELSHYKVFKKLTTLKRSPILQKGTLEVTLATENVLTIIRRLLHEIPIVLIVNFSNEELTLDMRSWSNIPEEMRIYVASVTSKLRIGEVVDTKSLKVPGAASFILSGQSIGLI